MMLCMYLCVCDKNDYLDLHENYVNNKAIDIPVWELNRYAAQYMATHAAQWKYGYVYISGWTRAYII
jgi:hypothetical protein